MPKETAKDRLARRAEVKAAAIETATPFPEAERASAPTTEPEGVERQQERATVQLIVRTTPELKAKLVAKARYDGVSLREVVERWLRGL